jgi:hypothetical protein
MNNNLTERTIDLITRKTDNNICWWNGETCPYDDGGGLRQILEMTKHCVHCGRFDREELSMILDKLIPPSTDDIEWEDIPAVNMLLKDREDEAREEGIDEGKREALKEVERFVHESLSTID